MNQQLARNHGGIAGRIIEVAAGLFYNQGYRATGINQVIQESAVAKATFYHHFASKDDLCLACLEVLKDRELVFLDEFMAGEESHGIEAYFLSILESLRPWSLKTNFRGCGFINIAAEVPDPDSPLRREGNILYNAIRERVQILSQALIASDTQRYAHLDVQQLTNDYMLIFAGAVVYLELYRDINYVDQAIDSMQRIIGTKA